MRSMLGRNVSSNEGAAAAIDRYSVFPALRLRKSPLVPRRRGFERLPFTTSADGPDSKRRCLALRAEEVVSRSGSRTSVDVSSPLDDVAHQVELTPATRTQARRPYRSDVHHVVRAGCRAARIRNIR